jgi:hypothetical protein
MVRTVSYPGPSTGLAPPKGGHPLVNQGPQPHPVLHTEIVVTNYPTGAEETHADLPSSLFSQVGIPSTLQCLPLNRWLPKCYQSHYAADRAPSSLQSTSSCVVLVLKTQFIWGSTCPQGKDHLTMKWSPLPSGAEVQLPWIRGESTLLGSSSAHGFC